MKRREIFEPLLTELFKFITELILVFIYGHTRPRLRPPHCHCARHISKTTHWLYRNAQLADVTRYGSLPGASTGAARLALMGKEKKVQYICATA